MCGRARASFGEASVDRFGRACSSGNGAAQAPLRKVDLHLHEAKHNMSPGDYSPILYFDGCAGQLTARAARWGLHPSFAPPSQRPNFFKAFNARSETVASKPLFSRLMSKQRCVVLLNGFYEYVMNPLHRLPHVCESAPVVTTRRDLWRDVVGGRPRAPGRSSLTTSRSERATTATSWRLPGCTTFGTPLPREGGRV